MSERLIKILLDMPILQFGDEIRSAGLMLHGKKTHSQQEEVP